MILDGNASRQAMFGFSECEYGLMMHGWNGIEYIDIFQ